MENKDLVLAPEFQVSERFEKSGLKKKKKGKWCKEYDICGNIILSLVMKEKEWMVKVIY